MGKIRAVAMGDEQSEKEQKRRAEARRQTKQSKKVKVEGVGMKGGERVAVVEGTDINPEFKKLIEEVEHGDKASTTKQKKKIKVKIRSKNYVKMASLVDKTKLYPLADAISLVKKTSLTKFDGTVELHVNLNAASLGDKKDYRGSVILPHGTGKQVRVVIADDKILSDVEAGKINFDILVAHPSMMPKLAKVARILGPKGLMPNPKTGTVTPDPEKRAKELSTGSVNFKTEPDQPLIHLTVGKVSFEDKKLTENVNAILDAIGRGKISKATLTATMSPGVKIALTWFMPQTPEHYDPKTNYAHDPRSHIVGILQLITARTAEEGQHGNVRPFIKGLVRTIRTRKYLDIQQVIETLAEIQEEQASVPKGRPHDWREKALLTVIKKLSEPKRRETYTE